MWASLARRPGRPATDSQPITANAQSGAAVNGGVLAAVLHELVDQQRILPKVKMHVAGQQVRSDKALVADDVALRILHLVGGLEAAVVPRDTAPVELVAAIELATRRQDVLLQGEQLAVAEAVNLPIHLDVDRDHIRHLVGGP